MPDALIQLVFSSAVKLTIGFLPVVLLYTSLSLLKEIIRYLLK